MCLPSFILKWYPSIGNAQECGFLYECVCMYVCMCFPGHNFSCFFCWRRISVLPVVVNKTFPLLLLTRCASITSSKVSACCTWLHFCNFYPGCGLYPSCLNLESGISTAPNALLTSYLLVVASRDPSLYTLPLSVFIRTRPVLKSPTQCPCLWQSHQDYLAVTCNGSTVTTHVEECYVIFQNI